MRHFNWAMGAVPEWALVGENHLLRSTSVVQKVTYGDRGVEYKTFDKTGSQVLRMNFKPTRLRAGDRDLEERLDLRAEGCTVQPLSVGDFLVRVRHTRSGEITIASK